MRGLCRGGNNANSRMRHASLGILVCIIWEEWNKRILDGTCTPIASLFRKFQILFYTIFHFHEHDHFALHIGWCYALCSLATLHFGCAGCLHHFLFSSLPSAVSMAGGGGSFICTPPLQRCVFYVFYVFLFLADIVLKSYTKVTMKLNWDIRLEIERWSACVEDASRSTLTVAGFQKTTMRAVPGASALEKYFHCLNRNLCIQATL